MSALFSTIARFTPLAVVALGSVNSASAQSQPSPRYLSSAVYDSHRNVIVLFGGATASGNSDETWEWDGYLWTQRFPTSSPSARSGSELAFDSGRGVTVLFGGDGDATGETWEWDGTEWTQRSPAHSPPWRRSHGLAFDPTRGTTVLFGGSTNGCSGDLNDTWEWDGADWVQLFAANSPGVRQSHSMAFDEVRGEIVLFGGHDACAGNYGDTWTWNGSDWSQVTPAAAAPVPMFGAPLAALPNSAGLMLHGGSNASGNASYTSTWTLEGDTWVEVGSSLTPGARAGHCTALHESTGRVLLYGGAAPFGGQKLGDSWVFAEGEWSRQLSFITSPINGHQYALTPVLNWTDAEALAVQMGGHLATIRDQAENDWLMSTFNTNAWIGFTDEASEGTWNWTSGETPGFTNWNAGEPNNLGGEDYAHLLVSAGKWNDAPNNPAFPGLVERVDCNGNGVPDTEDISTGTSLDCNGNGIPDECDIASGEALDCNGNGIPDTCDLAAGAAMDCNGNGVPDDCDLAAGLSLDCNANGIPDECDLAAGAADCNADGIPDSCQIAADSTLDLNANGTLDTCEAIGATYCSPAVSNSTGLSGEVTLLGSELIVLNQFFVSARQLPANSFGFFIASTVPGNINPVPNSQGTLCVIGDVGRGVGGGIFNAGLAGAHIGYANLLSMPQPNGPVAVLAGETWHFQAWYRDAIGGQTTSNFTDAVAVTFQ